MALTTAGLSVVLAGSVVPSGQFVAGILDNQGATMPRLFTVNQYTITAGTQTITASAPAVPPNGESALPTLTAVSPVMAADASGNFQPGYVKLTLTPAAGDTVNASSPQTIIVSPNALIILSSAGS